MKTSCFFCWMHGYQELTDSLQYRQVWRVTHDILNDVNIQCTDGGRNFGETFAETLLKTKQLNNKNHVILNQMHEMFRSYLKRYMNEWMNDRSMMDVLDE